MGHTTVTIVLVSLLATGCVWAAKAGVVAPSSEVSEPSAGALELYLGAAAGSVDKESVGSVGLAMRIKGGQDLKQFGVGLEGYRFAFRSRITPYVRGGLNVFQLELLATDEFSFGMLSPYAEVGVAIRVKRNDKELTYVLLGAAAEYDVRFGDAASAGYAMLNATIYWNTIVEQFKVPIGK